jgi:hypothetical protein
VDNGEEVLLKQKGGGADFDLTLSDNSVKRVRINLCRWSSKRFSEEQECPDLR